MRGIITKGVGGLYTVMAGDDVYECTTRGRFRQKDYPSPLVGDDVELEQVTGDEWAICDIHPRRSVLIRPNVANVEQLIITFSVKSPKPDLLLADKLTVAAHVQHMNVIVCITKSDLHDAMPYAAIYEKAGYPVVVTGKKGEQGANDLLALTKGKISALAGCSGVGKSTLINALGESFSMQTGEVSRKIERGRHTTRHVELLKLSGGGYILDTPGFSSFALATDIKLDEAFPEFQTGKMCRFSDCTHINEPDCAVKEALSAGHIAPSRYDNYVKLMIQQKERSAFR